MIVNINCYLVTILDYYDVYFCLMLFYVYSDDGTVVSAYNMFGYTLVLDITRGSYVSALLRTYAIPLCRLRSHCPFHFCSVYSTVTERVVGESEEH